MQNAELRKKMLTSVALVSLALALIVCGLAAFGFK
jgi:hypothetical protein